MLPRPRTVRRTTLLLLLGDMVAPLLTVLCNVQSLEPASPDSPPDYDNGDSGQGFSIFNYNRRSYITELERPASSVGSPRYRASLVAVRYLHDYRRVEGSMAG